VALFVMLGLDGPDGPERRSANRAGHVAHLESLEREGRIVLAGTPRNDENSASIGSVILFEARDLKEARAIVERDPFVTGGVYQTLTVAPFKQVMFGQS
jgi:uncharacterized protein YciI